MIYEHEVADIFVQIHMQSETLQKYTKSNCGQSTYQLKCLIIHDGCYIKVYYKIIRSYANTHVNTHHEIDKISLWHIMQVESFGGLLIR